MSNFCFPSFHNFFTNIILHFSDFGEEEDNDQDEEGYAEGALDGFYGDTPYDDEADAGGGGGPTPNYQQQ